MAIILVGRSESRLTDVAALINSKCETMVYICDISNKTEVIKLGRDVMHRFGRVDVLVNNAGFGFFGKVQDQSIEQIESVTATNYYGMIYCTKVFLDSMLYNKSGHIVNVASVAASFGVPGLAAYCGSKYAMLGFSESLYHELHGTGVGITVVSPIAVKTNFFNNESFGGKMPNYTGYALPPKTVSNAIMRAANSPRLEIIVPLFIRVGVWLKQTLPYIINPFVGAAFRRKLRR
jgi:short-subunit dehydrogenase